MSLHIVVDLIITPSQLETVENRVFKFIDKNRVTGTRLRHRKTLEELSGGLLRKMDLRRL